MIKLSDALNLILHDLRLEDQISEIGCGSSEYRISERSHYLDTRILGDHLYYVRLIQWLLCRLKGLQKLHKGLVGY
jgi:hypothetical protein